MCGPVDVYLSYAPDDVEHARALEEHLASLKRDRHIRAWHQRLVAPGMDVAHETDGRLRSARIIVLLTSSSYLASDYLHAKELLPSLARAAEGTVVVIPVLVRAHDWQHSPYGKLAVLPRSRVPVEGWAKRDDAWAEIAAAIRDTVESLDGASVAATSTPRKAAPAPRFDDVRIRALASELDDAMRRRRELVQVGAGTATVNDEILELRRKIREGGRLRAGDMLGDGRFRLIEPIGRGGFATVWSAFDHDRDEQVAVKVLYPELAQDPVQRERFFRGARVMAGLGHEAIVRVLSGQDEDGGWLYFVMELITGGDLHHAVSARAVPEERVVSILLTIGEALAEAHAKGLVHRDVKPANILLDAAGEPRLTDFDLVAFDDTTGGTRTGSAMGSWLYMAPEQRNDARTADARADVYGLGMTAVFCFYGKDLPDVREALPEQVIAGLSCSEEVKAVLARAIAVRPERRYADARAFCDALEQGMRGIGPASRMRRPRARWLTKPRAALAALGTMLTTLVFWRACAVKPSESPEKPIPPDIEVSIISSSASPLPIASAASPSLILSAASPSSPSPESTQHLFQDANKLYDEGKFVQAEALYGQVWKREKSYDIAGNYGNLLVDMYRPRDAAELLAFAVREFPAGGKPALRDALTKRLLEARRSIGTIHIVVNRPEASVYLDGRAMDPAQLAHEVYVDPGTHTLEVKLDGYSPGHKEFEARKGENMRVSVSLREPDGAALPLPVVTSAPGPVVIPEPAVPEPSVSASASVTPSPSSPSVPSAARRQPQPKLDLEF